MQAVLRRRPSTCLERAIVLQRWLLAHGRPHEVIIGVKSAADGVGAHAWLDFEAEDPQVAMYDELTRIGAT